MKKEINHHKYVFIFLFLVSYLVETRAMIQVPSFSDVATNTIFKEFQETDHLTIRTNLDSLLLNKKKGTYQKAQLIAVAGDSEKINLSIKIKSRGKSRRNMCELPPLKLNFNKTDLANLGLHQAFDKLKLITHCKLDGEMEDLLLKEYLSLIHI